MKAGIVGYGAYIPARFIECSAIDSRAEQLGLKHKTVANWDEDSLTMAVEAATAALGVGNIDPTTVGAVYFGSESPAYAVNPSSTVIADILGLNHSYQAVDLQFACKAATAGLQAALSQVAQGVIRYGLVIGSDKAQARPGDVLEWSAGAAAAALTVGTRGVLATIDGWASYTSDTPDFWRRPEERFPKHGGRFTGDEAYFKHVLGAADSLLTQMKFRAQDFDYAVFHMPNGKFPLRAAKQLGFTHQQLAPSLTVRAVGNPYSASALLGLVSVLEIAPPNARILMTAYGSGAGADSVILTTTELLTRRRWGGLQSLFARQKALSRDEYLEARS